MKSYDEMANDVFRRIGEYENAQKKRRKMQMKAAVSVCCVCFAALLGFGVWQSGWGSVEPPATLDDSINIGEQDYFDDAGKGHQSTDPTGMKQEIKVISLAQGSSGEFAADMYRPEGFHIHIGSALALKISIAENADQMFPVLVWAADETAYEEAVKKANNALEAPIRAEAALPVQITNDWNTADSEYYHLLTAEQILALADNGAMCFYIGSGEGAYENINWDTREGIDTFCELYGDMYVAEDSNIGYSPDICYE